ncbi:UNVERIFIED_ORG: prophage regulatory protein [Buttiauxella agrestis ATCC 33320]
MSKGNTDRPGFEKILFAGDVLSVAMCSRNALNAMIDAGEFPKPFKYGLRRRGWLESEILQWQAERIAKREG